MECLIVSRAPLFSDASKPPRATLPLHIYTPIKKAKPQSLRLATQNRHSLSLDTLSNPNLSPPYLNENTKTNTILTAKTEQTNTFITATESKQSKGKKRRKKKRASSHSISPQRVTGEIITPTKSAKIITNQNKVSKPAKQSKNPDPTFSPDKIIKRAISNILSRSVNEPHHSDKLLPYKATSMLKLAPSPPRHIYNRQIKTSPQRQPIACHKFIRPLTNEKRRIFLSETHNPGVTGFTSGRIPPLNSPMEVSHSVELVPSLGDAKSQVNLQKELRALETKRQISVRAQIERERAKSEKKAGEEKLRTKALFRAQIYALNSVMRDLEEIKFSEAKSAKV